MSEEDLARVRAVHGDRAARRYRALTDVCQVSLADYGRDGGAIPR